MNANTSRKTKQKDAIWQALHTEDDFVSAQDLHQVLNKSGCKIGLATVYRQLNALHMAGSLDCIEHGGLRLYRICSAQRHHHHHLVCESCGRTIEIQPPDGDWLQSIAQAHGFKVSSHVLEVYGLCSTCQKAR